MTRPWRPPAALALLAVTAPLAAASTTASTNGLAAPAASPRTVCSGSPSAGSLQGGRALEPRPYLRIKRGSESRRWGHALLLRVVNRGARLAAEAAPGSSALIGDLSAPRGGPISGHVSHQAGRDADVGFLAADDSGRPVALERFESFDARGRSLAEPAVFFDVYRNWLMLHAWLSDPRIPVTHVFVSSEVRALLLSYGASHPEFRSIAPLARRVLQPYPNHDDHFHVRIACPSDQGPECLDDLPKP